MAVRKKMTYQRRLGLSALICFVFALVAAFGWGNHWNAYTNLSFTLGDIVLWAVLFKSVSIEFDIQTHIRYTNKRR